MEHIVLEGNRITITQNIKPYDWFKSNWRSIWNIDTIVHVFD
jgi:hypothetical protein